MQKELKEHLLKKLINLCMCVIDKLVPEPRARYPQTKIVKHVFQHLFNAYCLEVWGGRFDDVPHQNLEGLQDKNFLHFLSATRKILLYVGENDRYYRAWIGLAFIAAKEEYGRALERLTQKEFRSNHLEMWEWAPLPVCDSYFEENKSELFEMMLTGHLSNLLRKRIDFDRFSAKQEKSWRLKKKTW